MHGFEFFRIADEAFAPFLGELGFSMDTPSISGRLYSVSFSSGTHSVQISYETADDEAARILVFTKEHGRKSDIDDTVKTPRLADLNRRYMREISIDERAANDAVFASIQVNDHEERLLLKAAKELRLVLPKYLGFSRGSGPR
jgi:hypothetical protein